MLPKPLQVSSSAYGLVLGHIVGSKLLQAERTDTEITVVFVADMASERFSPREVPMAVGTRIYLARISASFGFTGVFGVNVALQ
jgi:hypothetical protein